MNEPEKSGEKDKAAPTSSTGSQSNPVTPAPVPRSADWVPPVYRPCLDTDRIWDPVSRKYVSP